MKRSVLASFGALLLLCAFFVNSTDAGPVLSVSGTVTNADGSLAGDGLKVTVTNQTIGLSGTDTTGATAATSQYAVTLFDFSKSHSAGDALLIEVESATGQPLGGVQSVLPADVDGNPALVVNVQLSGLTVSLSEAVLDADGKSTSEITVQILGQDGQPVTDDTLTITSARGAVVTAAAHTAGGVYKATYTAPLTDQVSDTVTVKSTKLDVESSVTVTLKPVEPDLVVSVFPLSLVADGIATAAVSVTIEKAETPVIDEELSIGSAALKGSVSAFTNNGDGTYSATYTAGTTAGSDAFTIQTKASGAKTVTITLTAGPAASVAVAVTPDSVVGNGVAQAVLTITVKDANDNMVTGEALTLTSALAGSITAATDNGDGTYTAMYTAPFVSAVGADTVTATASTGVAGTSQIELLLEPPAENVALKVTGAVYLEDGLTTAGTGLDVTVTNLIKETTINLAPLTDTTHLLNGHIGYDVTFLDLSGQVVATTGDLIQVDVRRNGELLSLKTAMPRPLSSAEVEAGVLQFDVTTQIAAQALALKVTGQVLLEDGLTSAGLGIGVKITNLTKGSDSLTDTTRVLNGHIGYDVTFFGLGNPVADTGDELLIELTQGGQPIATLTPMPVLLTTAQVSAGVAEIDVTSDLGASSQALKVKGEVFLDDGLTSAAAGIGFTITNATKQLSIGLESQTGITRRLNGVIGYDVTFIDLSGRNVAETGDEITIELTQNGAPLPVLSPMPVILTSAQVTAGAAEIDVTADLQAQNVALQVAGAVLIEDGITPAPDGLRVVVQNVTNGLTAEGTTGVPSPGYSVTLLDLATGGTVASSGDRLEISVFDGALLRGFTTYLLDTTSVAQGVATGINLQFAGEATEITATASSTKLVANGVTTAVITVAAKDANQVPVSTEIIVPVLDGNNGTLSTVTNNGDGSYSITYTAGIKAGAVKATITATKGGVATAVDLTLVPGPTTTVDVIAAPTTVDADGTSTSDVTATLVDANGNLVGTDTVAMTATDGTLSDVTNNGDGSYSAVFTASKEPGTATVTATSKDGVADTVEITLRDNIPPTAVAGDDQTVPLGQTVTLDGSASTDNTRIVSYSWDFNVDDGVGEDADTAVATTSYDVPGAYTVRLTVTDAGGNTHEDDVLIIVGGLLVQGAVLEADGSPLGVDGVVQVAITNTTQGISITVPVVGGVYKGIFSNEEADQMAEGDTILIETVGVADSTQVFAPAAELTLSQQNLDLGSLSVADTTTDRTSTFTVSGTLVDADGNPISGATIEINGVSAVTASDGSYTLVLADYATNPVEDELLNVTVTSGDTRVRKQIIASLALRGVALDIAFTPLRVGGLAVSTKGYFDIIDNAIKQMVVNAGADGELPASDVQLLTQFIDLPQFILGPFLPVVYPDAFERSYPQLFRNMQNMDLENFGNAITPSPLTAIAEGFFQADAGLPLALAGNKFNVYVVAPSTDVADVTFTLSGPQSVLGNAVQIQPGDPTLTDFAFHLEEELALLFLPSWPGLDPTDPNPPTVFDTVTLRYAAGDEPPVATSGYLTEPMMAEVIDNKRVWSAMPVLEAGQRYSYYYEVKLKNPISLAGIGDVLIDTDTWIVPDPRNLQIEDRGLVDRLLDAARPVVNEIFVEIAGTVTSGGAFDADAILNKYIGQLTTALTPEFTAIAADMAANRDPMIVSRFTVPEVPAATEGSLWVGTFDLQGVQDGTYEVSIEALDASGVPTDQISGKQLILDRFAQSTSLAVDTGRDAALYQRNDGVYVAAGKTPTASLRFVATPKPTPGNGILFQMLEYADDPAIQVQLPWVPVNTVAIPLVVLRQVEPELAERFLANPSVETLQEVVAAAADLDLEELLAALITADPDGIQAVFDAYESYDQGTKDDIEKLSGIIVQLLSDPTNLPDLATLLEPAFFSNIQKVLGLAEKLNVNPLAFSGDTVDALIGDFIVGDYWVRAVPFDPVLNMETGDAPTMHIRLVPPVADVAELVKASIGDQNGDGDADDAFESGAAADFRIFSNVRQVELTAKFTTRTAHPVTLAFEYALPSAPDTWLPIGEVSQSEDEGQTGDEVSLAWVTDFGALTDGDDENVMVRVVATNAIEMTDAQMVTMALDKGPVPTDPAVFAFETVLVTVSPDSGGATGAVTLNAFTRTRTVTPVKHVLFQYSDGADWIDLAAVTDAVEVESANTAVIQAAVQALLAGGADFVIEPTYNMWTFEWDTTLVPDTIVAGDADERDAALDENPYSVRALTVDENDVQQVDPPEDTVSVDNVDDVAPLTGTQITAVGILDDLAAPIAAPMDADGVYVVNGETTISATPVAAVDTFALVRLDVLARDGDVAGASVLSEPIPLLDVTPGVLYTLVVESRDLPNGSYFLQVLAIDEAGNEEALDPALLVKVEIANIVDADGELFDIGDIEITFTGDLDLADDPRPLSLNPELRPIAGQVVFLARVKNAVHADLVVSQSDLADPEAISLAGEPILASVAGVVEPEGFTFTLDTTALSGDGDYVLNFRFFASPPVVPANGANIPVQVDNTAPTLAFVAPAVGTRVGPLPTLWASYADAGSGAHIIELTNSAPGGTDFAATVPGAIQGNDATPPRIYPADVETEPGLVILDDRVTYDPVEPLLPAGYTAFARVTDLAGNVSEATTQYIIERDTTRPVINFVSPQGVIVDATPLISVSFTDASPLDSATFAVDGAAAVDADEITRSSASYTPADALDQGEHTVKVLLTDAFDNAAEFTWAFSVEADAEPPTITATSPQGTVTIANPQVIVSASDNSGDLPTVTVDLVDASGATAGNATGDGTATISGLTLASGSYVAKATATDATGNAASAEWTFIVDLYVDTVPPVITATSPQGTVYVANPVVVASASDDSGDNPTVTLRLLSSSGATLQTNTGSAKATIQRTLTAGVYTARVTAEDAGGNTASAEWSFTVKLDSVAPVFTGTSPQGVVRVEDVDVVVSATDDSGDEPSITVELFSVATDGARGSEGTRTANGTATLSASGLASGTYVAVATARDGAGNTADTEWSFTVELDSIPPAITAVGPHGIIREAKPVISVTVTDDVSGVADIDIKLSSGGKNVTGKTTADSTKSSATFAPSKDLEAGVYKVAVTAEDEAGNEGTAEWSFTVEFDTEPPQISIVTPADHIRTLERRPVIAVSYTDNLAGVDTSSVKLTLTNPDGVAKDVTGESTIRVSQIQYTPAADLDIGVNTVDLMVADNDGNEAAVTWSFVVEAEVGIIKPRNYPNPFTAGTTIAFTLPRQSEVTIKIYDSSMRLVKTLMDRDVMEAGPQAIAWDATLDNDAVDEVARGLYFCQIIMKSELKPEQAVIKMVRRSE